MQGKNKYMLFVRDHTSCCSSMSLVISIDASKIYIYFFIAPFIFYGIESVSNIKQVRCKGCSKLRDIVGLSIQNISLH